MLLSICAILVFLWYMHLPSCTRTRMATPSNPWRRPKLIVVVLARGRKARLLQMIQTIISRQNMCILVGCYDCNATRYDQNHTVRVIHLSGPFRRAGSFMLLLRQLKQWTSDSTPVFLVDVDIIIKPAAINGMLVHLRNRAFLFPVVFSLYGKTPSHDCSDKDGQWFSLGHGMVMFRLFSFFNIKNNPWLQPKWQLKTTHGGEDVALYRTVPAHMRLRWNECNLQHASHKRVAW